MDFNENVKSTPKNFQHAFYPFIVTNQTIWQS